MGIESVILAPFYTMLSQTNLSHIHIYSTQNFWTIQIFLILM